MGGTTAKAALVEDGEVTRAAEYQVGGGIMTGSRLLTGAGYTLKVPAIDLAEVGAGGGSIIRVDAGGALRVGPESAGAMPGPACYDRGGEEPTVTDANVVLGYLNPEQLVGGEVPLNPARARAVLDARVAGPLGLELEHAAFGAHLVAASNMIRAIRAVSSERGRDPRGFTLVAFGGNGPLFAAGMAASLGIRRVLVPPVPGVFSSFGLLCARLEHDDARSLRTLLRAAELPALNEAFDDLERQARAQLAAEGVPASAIAIQRRAAMHYQGQIYELTVAVPDGPIAPAGVQALEEAFGHEHERTYGHRAGADEPVELVSVQLIASAADAEPPPLPDAARLLGQEAPARLGVRPAYFGPELGWLDTPVLRRGALAEPQTGPCIVEEYDATCLVPPRARAVLDRFGNIVIALVVEFSGWYPARTLRCRISGPSGPAARTYGRSRQYRCGNHAGRRLGLLGEAAVPHGDGGNGSEGRPQASARRDSNGALCRDRRLVGMEQRVRGRCGRTDRPRSQGVERTRGSGRILRRERPEASGGASGWRRGPCRSGCTRGWSRPGCWRS